MKKYEFDVAVVGGGFAGISAALSSARLGKKVCLVEASFMLGGLATSGLISYYLPICDGRGHQLFYSIPFELFMLSLKDGYEEKYPTAWLENGTLEDRINHRFECKFNPNLFALQTERLLLEEGVEIFYGSIVRGAKTTNGVIKEIEVASRTENFIIKATSYVDCTGDASLCQCAGEETAIPSFKNAPAYWYYANEDGAYKLKQKGSTDFVSEKDTLRSDSIHGIDTKELSIYMQGYHHAILDDFLSTGKDSPSHPLATLCTIPTIRMSRKLISKNDMSFDDDHKFNADSAGLFGDWSRPGPIYELSFSCLVGNKIKNLSVAGRCIGNKDLNIWNITRVIPVCALSGEACGVIASLTDSNGDYSIEEAQKILVSRKVPLHVSDII